MKRNKTWILMGALLMFAGLSVRALSAPSGAAGSATEAFAQANALYRDGKYAEAAAAYRKILDEGTVSSALYYNLGNACVKNGDLGHAILAYERSLKEDPRDPEARANLQYARSLLPDKTEENGLLALLGQIAPGKWLSWRENVWAFAGFYWIGALFGVAGILLRRKWKGPLFLSFALLGVALVLGLILFFRSTLWADPRAVVLSKELEVRYGPVMGESTAFTLHEGSIVRVLKTAGEWEQIHFAKGKIGWVTADALEKI